MTVLMTLVLFASTLAAGLAGIALGKRLHAALRDDVAKDTVRLVQALIASIVALVLGLMIASAADHHRTQQSRIQQLAADVVVLDRLLGHYGAAAAELRSTLRGMMQAAIRRGGANDPRTPDLAAGAVMNSFYDQLLRLTPQTDAQRIVHAKAIDLATVLAQARAIMAATEIGSPVQKPFLAVMLAWLAILFFGIGLFSRANATTISALMTGALAVAGAVFLILELEQTHQGLLQISDAPIRAALEQLGH